MDRIAGVGVNATVPTVVVHCQGDDGAARQLLEAVLHCGGVPVATVVDEVRVNADVLLAMGVRDGTTLTTAAAAASRCGTELVLWEPRSDVQAYAESRLQEAGVDAAIATTAPAVRQLRACLPASSVLHMLPPVDPGAVNAAWHSRKLHRIALAASLQLPAGLPWILVPGPHAPAATWQLAVRALARIVSDSWVAVLAPDTPEQASMLQHASLHLPHARVRIWAPPESSDRARLSVACDLCLWPCTDDDDGDALLQVQAGGMPVVAFRNAITEMRVRDGVSGRLLAAGNVEALANALSFLLRQPEFLQSMGRQAREAVLSEHGLEASGRTLLRFLRCRPWRQQGG